MNLVSFPRTIPVTVTPIARSTRADAKVIWVIVGRVVVRRGPFSTRVTVLRRVSTVRKSLPTITASIPPGFGLGLPSCGEEAPLFGAMGGERS